MRVAQQKYKTKKEGMLKMSMSSFPVSLLITQQIKPLIEGKTIAEIKCETYYKGRYSWHGDSFHNLEDVKNSKIIYADSNFILTDSNHIIEFGYFTGDLRYFNDVAEINIKPSKKSETDGYILTFYFTDNSCMTLILYSWSTWFSINENNIGQPEVIPKSPIEITDDIVFTLDNFKKWLAERGNMNIVENCSTVKGAFDIYNPVMSYILLISKIYPRTKTRSLSDDDIERLYNNIKNIVDDYKTGKRICEFDDIFGNKVNAENDVVWLNAGTLGKPCPVCCTPIDFTPCAGTKMYFCPSCQVKK